MKNRIGLILLAVICLGLGIALVMVKKQATEQQARDTEKIGRYSNEWVYTTKKLDEQTQVTAEYEKELGSQKKAFSELTNNFSRVSANLTEVSANLSTTEASLKASQEEVAKRDAKIADLETQNQALDKQAIELGSAITNLTIEISETKRKLAASEGNKAELENQLKRLLAEKAELEHQFNDLNVLRAQVRKLKEELAIARRLDWIRRGVYANTDLKGAQRLMQGSAALHPATPATNYDLNVEINSKGGARIIPPTNSPANTNPPAK
jgi:septal ring factor EnvC (AmiA/AmiB activator)